MKLSFICIGNDEISDLKLLLPELVKLGDEVLYVDGASTDGSVEFAKSLGCRVFERQRLMNANIHRSFAFEQVSGDWIFYTDPDEGFSQELINEIRQRVKENPEIRGFRVPRRNYFFGVWLKKGGQYPDYQHRVFKKGHGHFKNQGVHERLYMDGPVATLKTAMEHYPYRTMSHFLKKFDFYTTWEAKYLLQDGVKINTKNSIKFLITKPLNRFFRRYFVKQGFRDGIPGMFAALYDALGWMTRYFKLWELYRIQEQTGISQVPQDREQI